MKYAALLFLLFCCTGCSLFYDHNIKGHGFVIHSNQDAELTKMVKDKTTLIRHGYQQLFNLSNEELGTFSIFLRGGDSERIHLLGYYVPVLDWIVIYTDVELVREEGQLTTILLHEIAHHFLVTDHPEISNIPWLNEGLAGVFEMSLFMGWHFEFQTFNPTLFDWVRREEHKVVPEDMVRILTSDWSCFHKSEQKDRNYAVSWSVCWYLLNVYLDQDKPLGERIKIMYSLDPSELVKLAEGWHKFVMEFDEDEYLIDLVLNKGDDHRLRRLWAFLVMKEKQKHDAAVGGSKQPIQ